MATRPFIPSVRADLAKIDALEEQSAALQEQSARLQEQVTRLQEQLAARDPETAAEGFTHLCDDLIETHGLSARDAIERAAAMNPSGALAWRSQSRKTTTAASASAAAGDELISLAHAHMERDHIPFAAALQEARRARPDLVRAYYRDAEFAGAAAERKKAREARP